MELTEKAKDLLNSSDSADQIPALKKRLIGIAERMVANGDMNRTILLRRRTGGTWFFLMKINGKPTIAIQEEQE